MRCGPVQFTQITIGSDLAVERAKKQQSRVALGRLLGLTAFRFQFDNKLEFVNANVGCRNLGQVRHQGAELEAKWRPQPVRGLELGGANMLLENATGSVGRIPSYVVWNAHVGYALEWKGTRMKAGLGINNLLDRDYYFRGVDCSQGRMPQPERGVLATLQVDL